MAPAHLLRRAEWAAPVGGLGLAAAIVGTRASGPTATVLAGVATAGLFGWIVWQDLRSFTIPDAALLAIAAIAFALRWSAAVDDGETPARALGAMALDVGLCGGLLLAFREIYFRAKGVDGLGLGDVKLAAVGALLVGGPGFSWALFAASVLGLAAVGLLRLAAPARPRLARLAFGAVLAPAIWAVWLIEQTPAFRSVAGG